MPIIRIVTALLLAIVTLQACSPLGVYNSVVAQDEGVKATTGVAYGSQPRQTLDVYAPEGASKGVVVFVYGGSWNSGARGDYAFVGRALAARGYTTFIPDYRLVPEVRYPGFVADTAKAVAFAYRNAASYGANHARFFIAGHSAGAYNAMMVALAPEFLAAENLPASVIDGAVGLSGPYDFLPLDMGVTRAAFANAADLEATQPVNRARAGKGTGTLLLLHGGADTLVKPRNSEALAAAARTAGKSVRVRLFPGVDHAGTLLAFAKPRREGTPVLDEMVRFLDGLGR